MSTDPVECVTATKDDGKDRFTAAWNQLNLVLSFFARIDTKLSVVLGLDLGMLAMLATRAPSLEKFTAFQAVATSVCLIPIALSLYHLYQGSFPHLRGGTNSMVYFRTIAGMTEADFVSGYRGMNLFDLADDVLEQAWRNSKILSSKFDSLSRGYQWFLVGVVPWVAALASCSMK